MNNTALFFDEKAKGLAKTYLESEGQLLEVLIEMRRKRVFAGLNYSGIFDYCERALKFSRAQAFYFKSVAEKSDEVPEIKTAITQGVLTLSQARRIVPVLTKTNHQEWIEKAKSLNQIELEREVKAVNPKAYIREKIRPVARETWELRVPVNAKTEANLEALKDILSQKLGRAANLSSVVAWTAETTREKFDPLRRAARSRAISSGNENPGRSPIPVAVKNQVVLRDKNQCTYVSSDGRRCNQRRWLQLHHQMEVKNGGLNTVENLRTLCREHHVLEHKETGSG